MFNTTTYKPSNKFSVLGAVLMLLSMVAVGFLLSWLYLILTAWIPLIYLNILLAFGVSMGIGAIGSVFVKIYKMRAPKVALIISLLALLLVNYAKWAIYVARDYDKYVYDDMKDVSISKVSESYANLPTNESEAKEMLTSFYTLKGYKISDFLSSVEGASSYSSMLTVFGDDLYEFYTNIFGSTPEEILECCNKIRTSDMSFYDYMFKYRNVELRNGFWFMTHPGNLFTDIKAINEVGRWTIRSHRFSNTDTENDNVKGIMLWLVWIAELGVLMIPALIMIYKKASYPFIEQDNDWAVEEKPAPTFMFDDPYPNQGTGVGIIKGDLMRDPNNLFNMTPVSVVQAIPDKFYNITYCRSKYFDEIYVSVKHLAMVNARKNQRKTTDVITNLKVDADFLATLYGMFGYTVPPLCKGENKAEFYNKEKQEREKGNISGAAKSPTPPKATGAEAIFDEPVRTRPVQKPAPQFVQQTEQQPEEQFEEPQSGYAKPTSGSMDGIDTSNLDLDNFDFSKMN